MPHDIIFEPSVPAAVRSNIVAFFDSIRAGERPPRWAVALSALGNFRLAPLAVRRLRVSAKADSLFITYDVPHIGTLLRSVIGQAEAETAVRHLRTINSDSGAEYISRSERWSTPRDADAPLLDVKDSGLLRFSRALGRDIERYAADAEFRRLSDQPLGDTPLPLRASSLMAVFFLTFDIEPGAEMERITKETFVAIDPVLEKLTHEVRGLGFSLRMPVKWHDAAKLLGKRDADGLFYAGRTPSGGLLVAAAKREVDFSGRDDMKSEPELLLLAAELYLRENAEGEKVDSGDSRIAGLPARYFITGLRPRAKPAQRALTYVVVKHGAVYRLTFGCDEADFTAAKPIFMSIKESFEFRENY